MSWAAAAGAGPGCGGRHAEGVGRGELTPVTCHPTVPSNYRADKTLNLYLKVKPYGEAAVAGIANGGEFRFAARVS